MSPEQAAADPATDHRTDIYALGIVGYEMLAGAPPFHGRTPQALLAAQLTEAPAPIATRRYDVPVALANLLMKCLEKDPMARPKTASEVLRALETSDVVSGVFESQRPTLRNIARSQYARMGAGALVVAIIGFLALKSLLPPPPAAIPAAPDSTHAQAGLRLVVLPLEVPPGDTLSAAVADGVRSNLLRILSRVPTIQVATRGLSLGAIDSAKQRGAAPQISRQLEGTVQRSGRRLRITMRLVNPDQSVTLWSDMYERNVLDVFKTQDEVAQTVADTVTAKLGGRLPK